MYAAPWEEYEYMYSSTTAPWLSQLLRNSSEELRHELRKHYDTFPDWTGHNTHFAMDRDRFEKNT